MLTMDTQTITIIFGAVVFLLIVTVLRVAYLEIRQLMDTMDKLKSSDADVNEVSFGRNSRADSPSQVVDNNINPGGVSNSCSSKGME